MFLRVNHRTYNSGQVKDVWFVMWVDQESLEEVHKDLVQTGLLIGDRLDTERMPGRPDARVIRAASELILHREAVLTIQEMTGELYDETGELLIPDSPEGEDDGTVAPSGQAVN